ncbi:hypothetical protein B9Y66_06305 [Stenotrophomonas maltophilia]|nr:hypothetical protein B9Y66_06305 [Stenotrophomonas maltophilia]
MSTFLLSVSPVGVGTEEVESLNSLLFRLATANGLSIGQLLTLARRVRPHENTAHHNNPDQRPFDVRAQIDAVEELSGNSDLTRLTYSPASGLSGPGSQGASRAVRAWCEQCFAEDRSVERPMHDRLTWSSRFMMRCPFHRILLRRNCPRCGSLQSASLRGKGFSKHGLDHCLRCAASLIGPSDLLQPEFKPFFGEVEVRELVGAISTGELTSTKASCLRDFYHSLDGSGPLQDEMTSEMLPSIAHWQLPTITNVVTTACKYQVSLVSLILTPKLAAEQVNRFIFDSQFVPGRVRIKVEALLLQSIRATLEAGLSAPPEHPIPTLAQVGSLFSMRSLSFASLFPRLSEQYLERTRRQAARMLELGLVE